MSDYSRTTPVTLLTPAREVDGESDLDLLTD